MALPRLKPRPLRKPILPGGDTFGSMALQKTFQYSKTTWATISGTITLARPPVMPGSAHQVTIMVGTNSTMQSASHGLRRPPASAMAPRTGAVRAMIREAIEVRRLQVAWPLTGSAMTTVEK